MPVEVILPKVDMDMQSGQIAHWLVAEGSPVRQGEILFEIETDKAAMEVEAPASGVLAHVVGESGIDIPVGKAVAWIYADGETIDETPPHGSDNAGTGSINGVASKPRATPLARKLAQEAGIDLQSLTGSGPQGRIRRIDVETAIARQPSDQPPVPATDVTPHLFEPGSYETLAHDSMRRTIAARLTTSVQTIPTFHMAADCELDALLRVRAQLNADAAVKLSLTDLFIKALALALRDVPMANAAWTPDARLLHKHADIGVAVAISDGLITPIVRRAEQKSLTVINAEMRDLAARAQDKKLKPEEYKGGSTAISNLGMYDAQQFTSIINPPHASIVSLGTGVQQLVRRDGEIRDVTMMPVNFGFDHRVIDGAVGAQLASAFRKYVESPLLMLA